VTDCGLPLATASVSKIKESIGNREPAFFLDLDGTLAPLAARPDLVDVPMKSMRALVSIARHHLVCMVSGRGLEDLRNRIGLDSIYYAADHGQRIVGPAGSGIDLEIGGEHRGDLQAAARELDRRLGGVGGALIEAKGLSLAVHYRMVDELERPIVERAVIEVAGRFPALRLGGGKLVHELRPAGKWNKGRAMLWLLERLGLGQSDVCPVCLGDDLTDEDMFAAARGWGVTVVVGRPGRPTRAEFLANDCDDAAAFLTALDAHHD